MQKEGILKDFYEKEVSVSRLEKISETGYLKLPFDLLELKKHIKKNTSVLEIGCGTGRLGLSILTLFNIKEYIGIDIMKKYLSNFNSKLEIYKDYINSKYSIIETSFFSFKTRKKFDVILLPFSVIMEFRDYNLLFEKISKILKKGGVCIIDNHDSRVPLYTIDESKLNQFNYKEFTNLFKELNLEVKQYYFKVKSKKGFNREMILLYKK